MSFLLLVTIVSAEKEVLLVVAVAIAAEPQKESGCAK
jgi:hypothetical protein